MFLIVESMARGLDRVEVDVFYGRGVDLYRGVVVENDGGLKVGVPGLLFIQTHIHWGFRRAPAIETEGRRGSRKGTHVSLREKERGRKRGREGGIGQIVQTYLCKSLADVLIPRHNNKATVVMAIKSKNRVLVNNTNIALVAGI